MNDERYELALRRIMGTTCESSTSGIGSCWKDRSPTAYFLADRCCAPCIAHRALYPEADIYRSAVSP